MKISTNSMTQKSYTLGRFGWTGQNMTSDAFGFDAFGSPFGVGEFGGIAHFKNRTLPTVNH